MTVSVAMATYNGGAYISEQLLSIAAQTTRPDEIIISDDNSGDATWDIIQDFSQSSGLNVRAFRNERNLGHRENFVRAASYAQSGFLAFSDQDDIWAPDKLSRCLEPFADPEMVLVHHNARVIDAVGHPLGILHAPGTWAERRQPSEESPWRAGFGFTFVLRRSIWAMAEPFWQRSIDRNNPAERMPHDHWAAFLANTFGKTAFIDHALADYRQHGRNVSGWNETVTLRQRWRNAAKTRATEIENRLKAATNRADILRSMTTLDEPWRGQAQIAGERYRALADVCSKQAGIYRAGNIVSCGLSLASSAAAGAYASRTCWCNGTRELVKDLRFGMLTSR